MYIGKRVTAKLMPRYIRSTYKEYLKYIICHSQVGKQIGNFLDMLTLFLYIYKLKIDKIQIDAFLRGNVDYGSLDSA